MVVDELWGILTGLEVAWNRGFKKVRIEADSHVAVNMVNSSASNSGVVGSLLCIIKFFLDRIGE